MRKSWDMWGGGRFWDDQQRSLKDLRWQMCVKAKCKCVLWVLAWDGVPQGGLLSVLTLRDYTAHPSTLGAISHRLLLPLPSFPACQANRFSRALISGSAFAFFCALRHPLISLIPIWHQIIDTAGLLANSGVLRSTLDLCGCVSLALPLSPPIWLGAFCMPGCRFTRITSRHASSLTHASTHSLICVPVFISKHSLGVVCSRRGIVHWLLLKRSSNSAYQI